MRKAALLALAAAVLVLAGSSSAAQPRNDVKNYQHVFVIMMENTGYHALVGNPNAPWINSAIAKYGVATNAFGVTHPSQPNYIAATAGTRAGVPDDNDVTVNLPNIVDQLESHGKTWKAYMQSYSLCNGNALAHACGNQLYERKHNPFISFSDVQNNPARVANIVDFSQFATDLASGNVPDYSWISPDQCNDMHGRGGGGAADPCDFSHVQGLIATGDQFLANTVGAIQASPAWNGNSVIFITWDESDFTGSPTDFGFGDTSGCCTANPGGGHVLTLVISHSDHQARSSDVAYNHYSILRTIEDGWHLGCLAATCDTADVPAMTDLVGPAG
jgi:phospholipase C